jgi:dienelactone hydrolase
MQLLSSTFSDGVLERGFTVEHIPGVLWSPLSPAAPAPLVLMGHPAGLDTSTAGLVARARSLVSACGFHVASIDAPGHGARPRSAEDAARVDDLRRARAAGQPLGPLVSALNGSIAERAVPEWRTVLDALQALPEIDADRPVGYTGQTLAAEIGMRLAAIEPRIGAAVFGAAFASPSLLAAAARITVPVRFLLQWDDPEIDRESGLALFDALGSAQKTLHANPGPHQRVPWFETEDSERFLARHLVPAEELAA